MEKSGGSRWFRGSRRGRREGAETAEEEEGRNKERKRETPIQCK